MCVKHAQQQSTHCVHTWCGCRFGFNAHATYLHGLWAGQASANSDFAAIAWQFRLLGFNAIRLPFLFADLWTPAEMIGGAALHTQQHALPAAPLLQPVGSAHTVPLSALPHTSTGMFLLLPHRLLHAREHPAGAGAAHCRPRVQGHHQQGSTHPTCGPA